MMDTPIYCHDQPDLHVHVIFAQVSFKNRILNKLTMCIHREGTHMSSFKVCLNVHSDNLNWGS